MTAFLGRSTLAAVAFGLVAGCVTLKDITNGNTPLPSDFSNRVVYKDSASVRDNLSDFVGHVVEIDLASGAANKSLVRYVLANYQPPVKGVDPAAGKLYESKVSSSFKTDQKLSYLATLNVNVAGDQMLEVVLHDVAVASLDTDKIDVPRLKALVKDLKPKPGVLRCFVQGARIAAINYKIYKKITGAVKAAYGDTFQSGNEIYSSENTYSQDYKASIDCVDLDSVSSLLAGQGLGAEDTDAAFRAVLTKPEKYAPKAGAVLAGGLK